MATGAEYVNIEQKRVLGLADIDDRFFRYLQDADRELAARLYSLPGVFTAVTFGIAVADEFDLSPTSFYAEDGLGRLLQIPATESQNVPFPNVVATTYYVALTYAVSPVEVQTNPRTGLKFYTGWEERVGYSDVPTGVVDNGADLTFDLSTLLDPGEDHSGRQAIVWLNTPETGTFSEAVETCTVTYAAGVSKITTAGLLGQSSPSTTAADYTVMLVGPRVSAATNYSLSANHVYLGTVTGGGAGLPPAGSSTVGQRVYWSGGISDLSNVLETGPNGDTKIAVKAHAADVGVRQISVIDSAGLQQFEVDEGGNVEMGDGVASNPTLKLVPAAGTVPTLDRNGNNLRVSADRLDFVGVNGLHLSGGAGGREVIEGGQLLQLKWPGGGAEDFATVDLALNPNWVPTGVVDAVNEVARRADFTVGGGSVMSQFATLSAAIAHIKTLPASRGYRVLILGNITEAPGSLPIDLNGLSGITIEGAGRRGGPGIVSWSGNVPLFRLGGSVSSVTIRNLQLRYTEAVLPFASPGSNLTTRAALVQDSADGLCYDLLVENVYMIATGSTGLHCFCIMADRTYDATFRNIYADTGDGGFFFNEVRQSTINGFWNDDYTGVGASGGGIKNGIKFNDGINNVFKRMVLANRALSCIWQGNGVAGATSGCRRNSYRDIYVKSCNGSGIVIDSDSADTRIEACTFGTGVVGPAGIDIQGVPAGTPASRTRISDCYWEAACGIPIIYTVGVVPPTRTVVTGCDFNTFGGLLAAPGPLDRLDLTLCNIT